MSCDEIQESLALYFDNGLTADARSACDAHLNVCPVCRARLAELRSLTRSLGMLAAPITPKDLISSINQVLLAEADARRRREKTTFADLLGDLMSAWLQP